MIIGETRHSAEGLREGCYTNLNKEGRTEIK
jgi:hypothetical protein